MPVRCLPLKLPFRGVALGSDVGEIFGQDGTIGLGLAYNDDDTDGDREGQLMWASESPELWHDATEFPFVQLLPPPNDCDFDESDVCDIDDLNALQNALGSNDATYDLDDSGTVDAADTNSWLTIAGNKNIERPYPHGDADLDGDVDAADLNALGGNWQRTDGPGWDGGDFTGDGNANAADLNVLGNNWQVGVAAAPLSATVPEPGGLWLIALGLFTLIGCRYRFR